MKNDLEKKILENIKEKDLHPKARMLFVAENIAYWVLAGSLVALGACVAAVSYAVIENNQAGEYLENGKNAGRFIAVTLPYVWIILLGALIFLGYESYKKTPKGYKTKMSVVFLAFVMVSGGLGVALYKVGVGHEIEYAAQRHIGPYKSMIHKQQASFWHKPENGMISGVIVEIYEDGNMEIQDAEKEVWYIYNKARMPKHAPPFQEEMYVRCMGEEVSENEFEAHRIHPWLMKKVMETVEVK